MPNFFEGLRSTGLIGISVATFMLVGFGALFMAVFDDRLNGENATKLKETTREQEFELYGLEDKVKWAESTLLEQKRFEGVADELSEASEMLKVLTQKEVEITSQIEEEKKAFAQVEEEQLAYREKFREFVRTAAIGEAFEELTLKSGKVLKNLKIKEVLPDKVRFGTEFGTTSVAWDDLPDEMKERYQVGEGELEKLKAKLQAVRARRDELAADGKNERGIFLRESGLEKKLSRVERTLKEKTRSIELAQSRMAAFRAKAADFRRKSTSSNFNKATNARYASDAEKSGDALNSKISTLREEIVELRAEKDRAQRELEGLKSSR